MAGRGRCGRGNDFWHQAAAFRCAVQWVCHRWLCCRAARVMIASALGLSHRIPLPLRRAVSVLQNASVGPLPMSKPQARNVG